VRRGERIGRVGRGGEEKGRKDRGGKGWKEGRKWGEKAERRGEVRVHLVR